MAGSGPRFCGIVKVNPIWYRSNSFDKALKISAQLRAYPKTVFGEGLRPAARVSSPPETLSRRWLGRETGHNVLG